MLIFRKNIYKPRSLWYNSRMIDGSFNEIERREDLLRLFRTAYGTSPTRFFSSPGRAEIVGNHTDHNLGKVLVSAISCDILCAAAPRDDDIVEIRADAFNPIRFSVHDLVSREREKGKSVSLARGVLFYLAQQGYSFGGFSACTHSTVFRGAGVSSSAAFEVLVAEIVNRLYLGGRLSPAEKARAGQFAENVFYGKPCGLLDQSGIAFGGLNKIDFGSGEPLVEQLPTLSGYKLVLTNTGGSHSGLTAHYADVKREMAEVAAYFGKSYLREVSAGKLRDELPRLRKRVSDRAILRAFHFFEENDRVERAADALRRADAPAFFAQITGSGQSSLSFLQNCYISGETDQPIVLALKMSEKILKDGAYRMQGGGFTGTVLAFVKEGSEREYGREMARVFGRENVYYTDVRETGACEIEI